MKTYWGSGGIDPRILNVGADGGRWSVSRAGRFISGIRVPGTNWIGHLQALKLFHPSFCHTSLASCVYIDTAASVFGVEAFFPNVLVIPCIDICYSKLSDTFITFMIRHSVSCDRSDETHFCWLNSSHFFR